MRFRKYKKGKYEIVEIETDDPNLAFQFYGKEDFEVTIGESDD